MRGLLAIEQLYHAIVAGKKTQTRRSSGLEDVNDTSQQINGKVRSPDDCSLLEFYIAKDGKAIASFHKPSHIGYLIQKSLYKVGEMLYLKEPISVHKYGNPLHQQAHLYKFDHQHDQFDIKWSNKLFMPASAARAFVRITSIRCERLADISDADCLAEGIETYPSPGGINNLIYKQYGKFDGPSFCLTPKNSFLSLYKFANKVKEVPNLWVWFYEFEYLKNYMHDATI